MTAFIFGASLSLQDLFHICMNHVLIFMILWSDHDCLLLIKDSVLLSFGAQVNIVWTSTCCSDSPWPTASCELRNLL